MGSRVEKIILEPCIKMFVHSYRHVMPYIPGNIFLASCMLMYVHWTLSIIIILKYGSKFFKENCHLEQLFGGFTVC